MRIILSPAKKMNESEYLGPCGMPVYIEQAEEILNWLKQKSREELKTLWKCNDQLVEQNMDRIRHMNLYGRLTPAILSYEGIAYQYMAPGVLETQHYDYLEAHLRILSAFYGVLKPMDGVTPYRLEMQAKASIGGSKNLYDFWGRRLYDHVVDDSHIIINLASKEYSKCIEKFLTSEDHFITVNFMEQSGDRLVTKGTYAKMARGEMVRYMAEHNVEKPEDIKLFDRLGYAFREDMSSEKEYVFVKSIVK